jgi:hypothetical protein
VALVNHSRNSASASPRSRFSMGTDGRRSCPGPPSPYQAAFASPSSV